MRTSPPIRVAAALSFLLLSACATTSDPGWRGQGATPFDSAQAECRIEASASSPDGRDARFTTCMARHGWHRDGAGGR